MTRFNQQWLHRLGGPIDEHVPHDLADLAERLEAKLRAQQDTKPAYQVPEKTGREKPH